MKGGGRRAEENRIYANPLPIVFSLPEPSPTTSLFGLLGLSRNLVLNPHCEGVYDEVTRSVWVVNKRDIMVLWRRGFFGKGDLSRSEPTWLARKINSQQMAAKKGLTAEEMREKRRAERKQFKLDRAQAIVEAAAQAEAAFAEGKIIHPLLNEDGTRAIPSAATWKPSNTPADSSAQGVQTLQEDQEDLESIDDLEHLQLTLSEAFFLAWGLDCLTIVDPNTDRAMTLHEIWTTFQSLHWPVIPSHRPARFDNPFLVNYAVYHHFRSLGWVVKGGIKFCVDLLLYKRGPVFHHAEFALVVCPVYEDPADKETSPFNLQNIKPFDWSWLATINRVNSQVQKTLVLVYVTIPAMSKLSDAILRSPAGLKHYSVREVVLRRFIPARMRD